MHIDYGTIDILGEESTAPFPRPALSKKLWTDPDFRIDDADLDTAGATGAEIHLGVRAQSIDREAQTVTSSNGDTIGYGRLLLATGGHPKQIEGLAPATGSSTSAPSRTTSTCAS